jgi:CelD/BcsL family acetyltransferase involved in cellulose biosynthesis
MFQGILRPVKISQATFEGFEPLGEQWRALEADCPEAGFFQSWSWVGCLAEERYPNPVLFLAEEAGQTIGLALFNRHRGRLCLAENGAAMLDAPFIEHNGPLARDARVAAALLRAAWQVPGMARLRLNGVAPVLAEAAGGVMLRAQERLAPFVDLAALRRDERDFLASRSANTRQQIRRSLRFYAEPRLEAAADTAQALLWFDGLVAQHSASWQARGKPGAFASPFMLRFHLALIARAMPRGEVEMLRLCGAQGIIGHLYNFRHRGRVSAYQSGFPLEGAGNQGKPGLTSHMMAIERALMAGDAVYDFLGGADRYKLSLANGTVPLLWAELVRPWSLLGMAARLRRR